MEMEVLKPRLAQLNSSEFHYYFVSGPWLNSPGAERPEEARSAARSWGSKWD